MREANSDPKMAKKMNILLYIFTRFTLKTNWYSIPLYLLLPFKASTFTQINTILTFKYSFRMSFVTSTGFVGKSFQFKNKTFTGFEISGKSFGWIKNVEQFPFCLNFAMGGDCQ